MRSRLRSGFGNYSLPTCFNCLSEQWGGGGGLFRGDHSPTCFAAKYLVSLGLAWAERGMTALHTSILGL